MNWDQIEGKWEQMKGTMRQKWAKLTDDDVAYINGKRENLLGRLQERYGHSREQAERDADEWLDATFPRTRTTGSSSDPYVR